jgi:hypothetical protein
MKVYGYDSYPNEGITSISRKKAEDVFYDPKIATLTLIDEVYATVNDRIKLIKTSQLQKCYSTQHGKRFTKMASNGHYIVQR